MRRIKSTIIFCIIFLIVLLFDFLLYKNIEIFLPTHENELYSFENDLEKEKRDFLFEIYEQVEKQSNYKNIDDIELSNISKNDIVYNIIKNYIFKELTDNEFKQEVESILYVGELSDTIYGNLEVIFIPYIGIEKIEKFTTLWILYSKDMKKMCYIDEEILLIDNLEKAVGYDIFEVNEVFNSAEYEGNDIDSQEDKKSRIELANNCKRVFSNMIKNSEFEPDTIIYKGSYYILKDNERDITVYYNANNDVIIGLYYGFEK